VYSLTNFVPVVVRYWESAVNSQQSAVRGWCGGRNGQMGCPDSGSQQSAALRRSAMKIAPDEIRGNGRINYVPLPLRVCFIAKGLTGRGKGEGMAQICPTP